MKDKGGIGGFSRLNSSSGTFLIIQKIVISSIKRKM
jgi:hypothetical protein